MDGQSLSRLLHKRGINIRYLGKLADCASSQGPRLAALKTLAIQEMVSRAFKHIANRYLRYLPVPFASACVAHLLNCLLGARLNPHPVAEVDEIMRSLYQKADFDFEKVTPASLEEEIEAQIRLRYRFRLDQNWTNGVK